MVTTTTMLTKGDSVGVTSGDWTDNMLVYVNWKHNKWGEDELEEVEVNCDSLEVPLLLWIRWFQAWATWVQDWFSRQRKDPRVLEGGLTTCLKSFRNAVKAKSSFLLGSLELFVFFWLSVCESVASSRLFRSIKKNLVSEIAVERVRAVYRSLLKVFA
eukprot:Trichotokara_eunicae@DN5292_c0_g1_i13.p1